MNKSNTKKDIYDIGQILDISRNEINTMLKKKKWTLIVAIILLIFSALMLSGCVHAYYIAVCKSDFSWIWRLI